jgi:hypothetical protein
MGCTWPIEMSRNVINITNIHYSSKVNTDLSVYMSINISEEEGIWLALTLQM